MRKFFALLLVAGFCLLGSQQVAAQAANRVDLSVDKLHVVNTNRPTFVGKASPQAKINLNFGGTMTFALSVASGSDGWFAVLGESLPQSLQDGAYSISFAGQKANFVVQTAGQVLGSNTDTSNLIAQATVTDERAFGSANPVTATPRPTPTPTPIPTPVATPVPTPVPTPTPTPKPIATSSAVPVSGHVSNTIILAVLGFVLLSFSGYNLVKVHNKEG